MQPNVKNYKRVLELEGELKKLKKKFGSDYDKNYDKLLEVLQDKYAHSFGSIDIIFDGDEDFCFEFITKDKYPTFTVKAAFNDIPWNEIHDYNLKYWAFFIVKNVEATIRKW